MHGVAAAGSTATVVPSGDEDGQLLADIRRGDEAAFVTLVERYHASLLRLARLYVDPGAAEDVVQETWLGVLRGLHTFERRSSFKTWLFRILVNRARTRASRDGRHIALSSIVRHETDSDEPAVAPSRFQGGEGAHPGHWLLQPSADELPEECLLNCELEAVVQRALVALPPAQAEVVRLRDVEGLSAEEVCQLLDLTEGNQRVLLHRGRSKLRSALETYIGARRAA